jgi:prepilin-type N-terminal cleavage/methylation domain-containing protein
MKLCKQMKTQMQSQSGFTLIEVLFSISIFSIAILGLISTTNSVSLHQRGADEMTEATLIASDQMEAIKRVSANEPVGGVFGFEYFVNDQTGGYLASYSTPDNFTRILTETSVEDPDLPPGITRTTTVAVYPTAAQATEDFTLPADIHMVEVQVNVSWVSPTGTTKNTAVNTVLQRRQFIQ